MLCWSHQGDILRRHRFCKWWTWPVCHFEDWISIKWLFEYFARWPPVVCNRATNRGTIWLTLQMIADCITKIIIVSIGILISSFCLFIPDFIYSLHLILVWRKFWADCPEVPRSLDLPLRKALQLSWIIKSDIFINFWWNNSYNRPIFFNNLFLRLDMI